MKPSEAVLERASLATLVNSKLVVPSPATGFLAVERHFLASVLTDYITGIALDEAFYLKRHPDVEQAIRSRMVSSAADHYCRFGWWENRMPYPITADEDWYCEAYADVEQAIARRAYNSAQEHFDLRGFQEGRLPHPNFKLHMKDRLPVKTAA